jgi:hypothetical protein
MLFKTVSGSAFTMHLLHAANSCRAWMIQQTCWSTAALACCQTQHRTQQQLPNLQAMAQLSVLKQYRLTTLLLLV